MTLDIVFVITGSRIHILKYKLNFILNYLKYNYIKTFKTSN